MVVGHPLKQTPDSGRPSPSPDPETGEALLIPQREGSDLTLELERTDAGWRQKVVVPQSDAYPLRLGTADSENEWTASMQ